MNKHKRQALAELEAALTAARDAGRDHHKQEPEALLADVHRWASRLYESKETAFAFVEGFSAARKQRDDYLREKREAAEAV
jgi:hypothetical protein